MVSCNEKYKEHKASEDGITRLTAMTKALGFKESYEIQRKISLLGYRHLINAGTVEDVIKFLFDLGYDVIRPENDEERTGNMD